MLGQCWQIWPSFLAFDLTLIVGSSALWGHDTHLINCQDKSHKIVLDVPTLFVRTLPPPFI